MKLEADGAHAHGVDHPRQDCYATGFRQTTDAERALYAKAVRKAVAATRRCVACGVLAECDPSRPCAACGASHFHLIPQPRELASW
jgi:ABC-type ATPase with predicted acetyltransferase domain